MSPYILLKRKTLFLLVLWGIFSVGSVLAETITLSDVSIKKPRRTFFYNSGYYFGNENGNHDLIGDSVSQTRTTPIPASPPTLSTFGISVPVQSGDIIEVTFQGAMHGNACCIIYCQ